MSRFPVPASPKRKILNIEYFRGVDLNSASANVDIHRSPEAPNMIRDEVGKVRKRAGYSVIGSFPGKRINGVFNWGGVRLVHAEGVLYAQRDAGEDVLIYDGMADSRSRAWRFGGKLYIQDGKKLLAYDGETAKPAEENAYVPTIIISRNPTGGGTPLEPLNLLCRKWTESFLGTASVTTYQLTTSSLDADKVTAEVLNGNGGWHELKEGTDFTVNRATGRVTFTAAPGASPITGQDNVKITAAKTREGYANRINKCDIGAVYGVNGSPDRLFVSGNPEHPNLDYYSQINDPTYFGDTWYSKLGQEGTEIVGYSVVGNLLAAHKRDSGDGRNVVLRSGVLAGDEAAFPIVNALQGQGAIGKYTFGYLASEPLFLTELGVYAITSAELTGDRYAQQRSFYIAPALQSETGLEEACGFVWRDFYMLAMNNRVYVLDGLQKTYEPGAPYSTYQYECYTWTGIDARVMWEEDGALCFGTSGGILCRFNTDTDSPAAYSDAGQPIRAYWDTPDIDGDSFYRNKTFRHLAVRLASAPQTGLKVYAQKKGIWSLIYDAGEKARYFDWEYVDFSKLVFSSDRTPKTLGGKIKIKKADKVRFRIQNEALDEPFGIYALALEYTEGNYYKG